MKKFVMMILLLSAFFAQAQEFSEFQNRVLNNSETYRTEGLSYLISGSIALAGGSYGVSRSDKPVEKGFYSIAQSLGLIAIGFGAEQYFLKHDDEIFIQVLNSGGLTTQQKDKMVRVYLKEREEREEKIKWIRRTTFGMAGILSAMQASQTQDDTLKNLLYFTAGVQLVWAVTF